MGPDERTTPPSRFAGKSGGLGSTSRFNPAARAGTSGTSGTGRPATSTSHNPVPSTGHQPHEPLPRQESPPAPAGMAASGSEKQPGAALDHTADAQLNIIVYKGDPVDLMKTRHTALLVVFADKTTVLVHTVGAAGDFTVQQRPDEQPRNSKTFVAEIPVAAIKGKSKSMIQSTIAATPVNNSTYDWDCQKWVGDALTRLSNLEWITTVQKSDGISKMVDVIFEAEDEE